MSKLLFIILVEIAMSIFGTLFFVWLRESTRDRVCVTPRGKSYHNIDCPQLRGNYKLIDREEAISRNLNACSRCGG